jgi:hypothetical protein
MGFNVKLKVYVLSGHLKCSVRMECGEFKKCWNTGDETRHIPDKSPS